jgi:hypothetical protein
MSYEYRSKLSLECYKRLIEESLPEQEALEKAGVLVREGYQQTSHKYRIVTHTLPGKDALEFIKEHYPNEYDGLLISADNYLKMSAADLYHRSIAAKIGKEEILDLRTFKAFKEIESKK